MGNKMSERDLEIYKKIDEILYFDWNPIGVGELPRDEYTSYTPKIFNLKKLGSNSETIAQALCELELYILGLPCDIEICREIAKKIESI
jgi:hypothetical protein